MDEKTKRVYFAYGSNMDRRQMEERCPDSELVGSAKLEGWRFLINTRNVATIVPDHSSVVYGVPWRISASDEKTLDGYEGVRYGTYRKDELDVEVTDGPSEKALVYIARDTEEGKPGEDYIKKIIAAAEEHDLPAEYIAELQSWR